MDCITLGFSTGFWSGLVGSRADVSILQQYHNTHTYYCYYVDNIVKLILSSQVVLHTSYLNRILCTPTTCTTLPSCDVSIGLDRSHEDLGISSVI